MTLEVQNVGKRYQQRCGVKNVSFATEPGEFLTLVGPSGCGKTTLLRLIAGLEQWDEGQVLVKGRSVANLPPRDRNIAMVFQGESLYPHLSVRQNLEFPLRMRSQATDQREQAVTEIAKRMGIGDLLQRDPATLSGGQRQRVALGRALVRQPAVFLLDEPFSHLDIHLRRQLCNELLEWRKEWTATTLFVTHDLREAMLLGDRIIVMDAGAIQQIGTPEQLRRQPSTEFVATFFDEAEESS